ncbi:hypothetical protein M0Q97_02160 [Candidatus Dojkabacteria bacterium]|jgi:hypothetical protein|nr:hypothetical protein [Candidatus Dojkabacteria bacterium]
MKNIKNWDTFNEYVVSGFGNKIFKTSDERFLDRVVTVEFKLLDITDLDDKIVKINLEHKNDVEIYIYDTFKARELGLDPTLSLKLHKFAEELHIEYTSKNKTDKRIFTKKNFPLTIRNLFNTNYASDITNLFNILHNNITRWNDY